MRKFKTLAVLSYQPALHYGISGLVFLLSLSVAQAAPIIIDGGATRNEVGSSPPSVNNDIIVIGDFTTGTLNILDGGRVTGTKGYIGNNAGSSGIVNVSGTSIFNVSSWTSSDSVYIGHGGTGELNISNGGTVSAPEINIAFLAGSIGSLNIGSAAGNVASGPGVLNAATVNFGDGSGKIVFNHTDNSGNYIFAPTISGNGNISVYSGTTLLAAPNNNSGTMTIYGGTLTSGGVGAFSRHADYITEAGGALNLNGYSETLSTLNHGGILNFGSNPNTILTIAGNYTGNNGLLNFNAVLSDDSSLTDKLVVVGDTSGTTYVQANNLGGGGGRTLNGIELITVGGVSAGEFIQSGRIVAGAYDYYLERGLADNAGNWYLSNALPTTGPEGPAPMTERPEGSSYSANLAAANNMFVTRLHDRMGETYYIDALTGEKKITSLWLRNEGGHNRSRDTQDQLRTQSNRYVMQLGGDIAQWNSNKVDRFNLGIMAGYGNSQSKTESRLNSYSARALVEGYSTGIYGTWYANDVHKIGLYLDSWVQYSWFNNTVDGQNLANEEYKSKGVTASVESGYTFKIGENTAKNATYFIQPKAQVTWMGIKADDHKEANGTHVSGEGNGNIQTRLGVKAFMSVYADQDRGKDREFQPFVETNWVHNTKDFGTTMDGISIKQDGAANIAELKVGVEGQLNQHVELWGNVGQQVGNKGYSDTAVMLGIKYNF